MILNLKHFNESIEYQKFNLDPLESSLKLETYGCFMALADVTNAYYSSPLDVDYQYHHQSLLRDKIISIYKPF